MNKTAKTAVTPPDHLSSATRRWFVQVCEDYALEPHHRLILTGSAEAWDRKERARRTIKREGLFYTDRFGQPKAHPAADVERQALDQFRAMLRELGLDVAPPNETRPPVPAANAFRGR
jgi:P27 family predicted phage terminase small subunit